VALRISDTGPGISAEDQAKLFQPFTQVGAGSRSRRQGTGLGLHLSRKLAELLGGDIQLHSEPGQGSTFTLLLEEA
jgi:protein-histidine pros-kinase